MNKGVVGEFKEFILQGNVVSLAVAVVIGAAFGAVVTSVVDSLIMPLIAAIGGQPDFSAIGITLNEKNGEKNIIGIGNILNALIAFLVVAAVVFFVVVKPMNALIAKTAKEETADPTTTKCPYCFTEVPNEATRCPACTSELQAVTA